MLRLLLRVQHLLQGQHFVHEKSVGLGHLGEQLLELLHLLLCRRELLSHDTDVVRGCKVLGGLGSSRRRRLSPNVVEVIFASHSEVWMFELQSLGAVFRMASSNTTYRCTYVGTIRGIGIIVSLPYFVKVILVKLSHKASHVAVLEMLW